VARALWKGHLKIEELSCAVALYAAASTSERVSFHTINRKTGHRVKRQYVDPETGKEVDRDQQVKGYETSKDQFIVLEPDEVAAAVPESDKTLSVEAFVPYDEIDTVFFDRPYFIAPADKHSESVFAVIREGMRAQKVAAIANAVLFRRQRKVLIRPEDAGFVANTLNFEYEVRSADEVFEEVPDLKIGGEMLELAQHIISTKTGKFDLSEFDDRYDAALAELVKAKMEGRKIEAPKRKREEKVVSLLDALRESAAAAGAKPPAPSRRRAASGKAKKATAAERRKAG
jgi:DNA end-binding protein Ku